ncbi:MAG: hypothetical protein WB785_00150 [Mycobacterium sp.]|uniref:DUF7373 family lipoprotein n=1 Tax=Mycobacterium sp. TaxID=1785 RepID=UPI003C40BB26
MQGRRLGRALGAALVAVCVVALVGCSAMVAGVAVKAPDRAEADGAIVALLDTGDYPTTANHPFGTAGNANTGAMLEAHRLAVNVVGPWQVDPTYRHVAVMNTTTTSPLPEAKLLSQNNVLADPMPAVAMAHGFMTGFSSFRRASTKKLLVNVVLRFPDVDSAGAAAREMADQYPHADAPARLVTIDGHPEAIATLYDFPDGGVGAASFTARGPYVLVQQLQIEDRYDAATAPVLIGLTLDQQEPLIDRFTPTDSAKLIDLPKDPTGQLLARTLWATDGSAPFMIGVWEPGAWLNFEDDPIKAAGLFKSAGVEAVAQQRATVYQTHDAAGATQLVKQFAADMKATEGAHQISGITGLPQAQCFARQNAAGLLEEPNPPLSWLRVVWPFKCVARADRYTFTAFSDSEKDVKQQMAAQYRILAGK